MAGHPLRPATDQSLGEPLPRQQANRARAPPPTILRPLSPAAEATGISCGISPAFAGVSPTEGKVAHVLRTRSPCAYTLYCYRVLRIRLACVKHAASVRSEPGSNSRLNPMLPNSPATRLMEFADCVLLRGALRRGIFEWQILVKESPKI